MLYVVSKNGDKTWHVGQDIDVTVSEVVEIQADGDELAWIVQNFKNLPIFIGGRVQNWYGYDAQFIANHL